MNMTISISELLKQHISVKSNYKSAEKTYPGQGDGMVLPHHTFPSLEAKGKKKKNVKNL